jgi:hypothetical protein
MLITSASGWKLVDTYCPESPMKASHPRFVGQSTTSGRVGDEVAQSRRSGPNISYIEALPWSGNQRG